VLTRTVERNGTVYQMTTRRKRRPPPEDGAGTGQASPGQLPPPPEQTPASPQAGTGPREKAADRLNGLLRWAARRQDQQVIECAKSVARRGPGKRPEDRVSKLQRLGALIVAGADAYQKVLDLRHKENQEYEQARARQPSAGDEPAAEGDGVT
jgi:hypothetical protein